MSTDLYAFLYNVIFPTQIEILFGTSFLTLHPNFVSDFREFHQGLAYLLRGYPRWLVPKAWDARERCLTSIKKWHAYVQEQQPDKTSLSHEDRSFKYGSQFISARQEMHSKIEALDADDIASSELGVIWA